MDQLERKTVGILVSGSFLLVFVLVLNYFNILPLSRSLPDQFGWLPHRSFEKTGIPSKGFPFFSSTFVFQINEISIPKDTFLSAYQYYLLGYKSRDKSIRDAQNLFFTHYVLKKKFLDLGHTQQELEDASQGKTHLVEKMAEEISHMKTVLFALVGVTWRSGEVLAIRTHGQLIEGGQPVAEQIAQEKLANLKRQFESGTPFSQVRQSFIEDTQIELLNGGQGGIYTFERITPQSPDIQAPQFKEAVFSLSPGEMSDIVPFTSEQKQVWTLTLIYVQDGASGTFENIDQWIEGDIKSLRVQSDFEGIR